MDATIEFEIPFNSDGKNVFVKGIHLTKDEEEISFAVKLPYSIYFAIIKYFMDEKARYYNEWGEIAGVGFCYLENLMELKDESIYLNDYESLTFDEIESGKEIPKVWYKVAIYLEGLSSYSCDMEHG